MAKHAGGCDRLTTDDYNYSKNNIAIHLTTRFSFSHIAFQWHQLATSISASAKRRRSRNIVADSEVEEFCGRLGLLRIGGGPGGHGRARFVQWQNGAENRPVGLNI
ncbi:hypothetical protein [Paucidesulfovibrio longus]|uniref:hypothetical protein n=1 Tax=Paucidesulfovibrio longus TaxID=889 RepID=UPI0012DF8C82|nr:hypothetical protein [Paucidesulfovibrio longus]